MNHTYIKKFILAMARYLEEHAFCKPHCTSRTIAEALEAKDVKCDILRPKDSLCKHSTFKFVVQVPVRNYTVVVDEEMFAVDMTTGEIIRDWGSI